MSLWALALFSSPAAAQLPDPALLAKINAIRAIDNHSHTPALTAPGEKDDNYDALPCEPLEPTEPTLTGLPDNPAFLEAWRSLFGYPYNDRTPAHVRTIRRVSMAPRADESFVDFTVAELAAVSVADDGIGIPQADQEQIFRKF